MTCIVDEPNLKAIFELVKGDEMEWKWIELMKIPLFRYLKSRWN